MHKWYKKLDTYTTKGSHTEHISKSNKPIIRQYKHLTMTQTVQDKVGKANFHPKTLSTSLVLKENAN